MVTCSKFTELPETFKTCIYCSSGVTVVARVTVYIFAILRLVQMRNVYIDSQRI